MGCDFIVHFSGFLSVNTEQKDTCNCSYASYIRHQLRQSSSISCKYEQIKGSLIEMENQDTFEII